MKAGYGAVASFACSLAPSLMDASNEEISDSISLESASPDTIHSGRPDLPYAAPRIVPSTDPLQGEQEETRTPRNHRNQNHDKNIVEH